MSAAGAPTLPRRLLPLQIGVALQGLILWVPIEKLFMTEIGFDAASVGAMAAAYAAVVPLLEVPSGILADRWSRSWVLVLACLALLVSSLIGGLSHNVITYVIAAMVLGLRRGGRYRRRRRGDLSARWPAAPRSNGPPRCGRSPGSGRSGSIARSGAACVPRRGGGPAAAAPRLPPSLALGRRAVGTVVPVLRGQALC
jgi:hypothetical protein